MDRLEEVAAALHEGWLEFQRSHGKIYGPLRTCTTHPHIIAWEELDDESRNQDRFIAAVLLRDWFEGRLSRQGLAAAIHDTWARWEQLHGNTHPHAVPFPEAHPEGSTEHELQAARLEPLLGAWPRESGAPEVGR